MNRTQFVIKTIKPKFGKTGYFILISSYAIDKKQK